MPWNSPSSQPTSWAWATRSSASLGGASSLSNGERQAVELGPQVRRQSLGQFLDRRLVDLPQPGPALLVQRGVANLLQQLLDHGADAQDLGRLLDRFGVRPRHLAVLGRGGDDLRLLRLISHRALPSGP